MATVTLTKEYRLFGLPQEEVCRRLEQNPSAALPAVEVRHEDEETVLTLTAVGTAGEAQQMLDNAEDWLSELFGIYIYSREGESLAHRVVALLGTHGLTLATAESCTGGLVAQQLTAVPGCSKVFGTGVVSYSASCKQALLGVQGDTLAAEGAVSAATAGEMARGVRRQSGASLGVSVTGEAGPVPAEDHPVGTVFIALADAKRTWIKEYHLEAPARDRNGIRRVAAGYMLDLVRRYLEAYPTVMAGGQPHRLASQRREIPRSAVPRTKQLLARLLPWQGDSPRRLVVKSAAWLCAFALLVGGMLAAYRYLLAPDSNRQLQDSLGEIYWGEAEDLTGDTAPTGNYPLGMMRQFQGLYDRNADVRGWIRIPDTAIDYPVMTYRDGYYQNHNFSDQYSVYGQPYFGKDTLISPLAADRTITVYGKNSGDGQMFSELLSYRRIAYLRERPLIEMNTLFAVGRYEIFAVLVADERNKNEFDYARTAFADDKDFEAYLQNLQRRSLYRADSTVTAQDRVLLLSTDAQSVYGFSGARLVVAARLITGESTVTYRANNSVVYPSAMSDRNHTTARATTATQSVTEAVQSTTSTSMTAETEATASVTESTTATAATTKTTVTTVTTTTSADDGATTTASTTDEGVTTATTATTSALSAQTTTKTEVHLYADIGD